MRISEQREQTSHCVHATFEHEADDGSESVHLRTSDVMARMLRQPRIVHRLDERFGTEVLGQKLRARLLLAKTQSQSLDASDD
ncbi:hypothetical protein D3C86_1990120 [compost metagenome]